MSPISERRFCVAGLEVAVRAVGASSQSVGLDHMSGFYEHYPSGGGEPRCIVNVDIQTDYQVGPERGPNYPAFEEQRVSATDAASVTAFIRYDVTGKVSSIPTMDAMDADRETVVGDFRVGASPNSLEAAIRVCVSAALPTCGALIFHSSAVAGSDGVAQLFLGISGRGKSTIAAMLADRDEGASATNITKVSDELVIVRKTEGGAEALVSPFIGSLGLPHGQSFPLGAFNMLVQAKEHSRRSISTAVALPQLMRHAVNFARDPQVLSRLLELQLSFCADVPCFELEFAKRPDVATVLGLAG